jgi:hypothetical protein
MLIENLKEPGISAAAATLEQGGEKEAVPEDDSGAMM